MTSLTPWLEEALAPLGEVKVRAMFGGYGVSLDGLAFGLIADDVLYLKCDGGTEARFEAAGLAAFTYDKGGQPVAMRYRRAPDEAMDDADMMREWTELALSAARRARKTGQPRRAPRGAMTRPW